MKLRQDEYAALVFRLQSYGKYRNETDSNLSKMIQISVGTPETACNAGGKECAYQEPKTHARPTSDAPFIAAHRRKNVNIHILFRQHGKYCGGGLYII